MLETNSKFVAIIPARGGSKSIPRKNIVELNNKPLIYYSIQAALDCPYIQKCIVSTDSQEIADIAVSFGVDVIERPASISGDFASSEDVVEHVIKEGLGLNEFDYFVLLQPTSPLRKSIHVTECINQFIQSHCKSSVSVCVAEHHPYKMVKIQEQEIYPIFGEEDLHKPRQALPTFFRINGAIYISSIKNFISEKNLFHAPVMPYVMKQEKSVDIDTYFDLMVAELLLKQENES